MPGVHEDVQILRIGANSERAVDLFHGLLAALPNTVNIAIESLRDCLAWRGDECSRNDVRDAVARLKLLLSSYGGVEIAAYSLADQITLTPELEVFVYSRRHRWRAQLLSMGLEERANTPTAVWQPTRHNLKPAPELSDALASAAQRLRLQLVKPELCVP